MFDSRFRGWIYWVCFVVYCGFAYLAGVVLTDTYTSIIVLIIPVILLAILLRIEHSNLLTYLHWYHRSTLDTFNDSWYFRHWGLSELIFSNKLESDPELMRYKRNYRHAWIVCIAMIIIYIVAGVFLAFNR